MKRVVLNMLAKQCGFAASYSRLRRFSSPSSSQKPIHLTLLFLQVASVSCPICQSPFFFSGFPPASLALRKQAHLFWSAWGVVSFFFFFFAARLSVFLCSFHSRF